MGYCSFRDLFVPVKRLWSENRLWAGKRLREETKKMSMHHLSISKLGVALVVGLVACSGGGDGLPAMEPLPGGFDTDLRIENAATVRVNQSGLEFTGNNIKAIAAQFMDTNPELGDGVFSFPIPSTKMDITLGTAITVCADGADPATGKCLAEIDLGNADVGIYVKKPNNLVVKGVVPIRVRNLPIKGTALFIPVPAIYGALSGGGNDDCDIETMSFVEMPVELEVAIAVEKNKDHLARLGYSKVSIAKVSVSQDTVSKALHFCGESFVENAINTIKPYVGGFIVDTLTKTLTDTVNEMLCVKPDSAATPTCPIGSSDDGGFCKYADKSCVSMMLGLDGHIDLGPMLAAVSPATSGALDFVFAGGGIGARDDVATASFGDLNPAANGMTLGFYGGVKAAPNTTCIKPVELTIPTGIPQPDETRVNDLPGWPGSGPDVAIAVSERFLNYALGSAYNSGLLCIDISTEQMDLLSTGLFGLLVPSIPYLAHQKQRAPLSIAVRPKQPPTATIGNNTDIVTDPLVRAGMKEAVIDIYVWSSDRFIRAFTAQFDLNIPVNVTVSDAGLTPILDKIYVSNATVTNSDLLSEDPTIIAEALASVIEGIVGSFIGTLPAIPVSGMISALGLELKLDQAGIRKLEKGDDRFLGVFVGIEASESAATSTSFPSEKGKTPAASVAIGKSKRSQTAPTGCAVTRDSSNFNPVAMLLLGLGIAGAKMRKNRDRWRLLRNSIAAATAVGIAGSLPGCTCGSGSDDPPETEDAAPEGDTDELIKLQPGLIGSYTSADMGKDGTIWVAGYNEADWDNNASYGDLVVGKYDGSKVQWEIVDGVPDQEVDDTVYDVESWRGGNDYPGPDVGLWTSLKVDPSGNPRVSYWDLTNKTLKYARREGDSWRISTIF
ncbi:MAG: hypothetical protein FWD57_14915, partial [Polyangiaceae bacterium]|nr:hypothetical protein [Polyangiaceae bacterium]